VTLPEEALERARARAAELRAQGGYAQDLGERRIEPTDRVTGERLFEWSLIEPDLETVRSTRRLGAPITWFKRVLLHVVRQYHNELIAEQTRFNVHAVVYVTELEERVRELEARLAERDGPGGDAPPR
jgi:hypothetical protein